MRLNLKSPKIFYGWWIVGACFLIALYSGGVIGYGFTAVFEPIADEFGWSYTLISLAASLRGLETGLISPLLGILVDRLGPRRLVFVGVIISCLGLIFLSRVNSLGMFYLAFALVGMGESSRSSTVLMTAVANWFRRRIGTASGIVASGWGFAGLLVPVVVILISMYGWRTAMVIFALGMLAICLPLSLLIRHKAEQYGYLPDGMVGGAQVPDAALIVTQTIEVDIRAKQALKSRIFWHMALAQMFQAVALSSVVIHVMPYLSSIKIARSTSGLVASGIPLLSILGRLGLGWLADKFDKRLLSAGAFAMIGLGLLCFGYAATGGTWLLLPFLILFSIGYGANTPLRASLVGEFFGRSNFGTILGFIMGLSMVGYIAGPPLAGWVFDNWGSYQAIWFIFACLSVVALVMIVTIPPVHSTVKPAKET